MRRLERELLGHVGNHVRLRDRLAAFDRQRDVLIGVFGEGLVDEHLARDGLDGAQHFGVADTATPQLHDKADLVLGACHPVSLREAAPRERVLRRVSADSTPGC